MAIMHSKISKCIKFHIICALLITQKVEVESAKSVKSFGSAEIKVPICTSSNGSWENTISQNALNRNETLLKNMFYVIESHISENFSGNYNHTFSTIQPNCKIGNRLSQVQTKVGKPLLSPTIRGRNPGVPNSIPDSADKFHFSVESEGRLSYKLDHANISSATRPMCLSLLKDGTKLDIFSCEPTPTPRKPLLLKNWRRRCSEKYPCIRKCCDESEYWDISLNECVPHENLQHFQPWKPAFYNWTNDFDCVVKLPGLFGNQNQSTDNLQSKTGLPRNCLEVEDRHTIPSRNIPDFGLGRYRMLVNGSVLMNYDNATWIPLREGSYCVDEIFSKRKFVTIDGTSYHRSANVLLVCKDEYQLKAPKRTIPIRYAMMLFSAAVILLFTVVAYLLVWDKHNIYEWTVFFEVLTMIFMIIFLAISHTIARDPSEGYLGTKRCVFLGMASHYFFIATFFWLLVINFEIWWNFRTLTISTSKSRKWLRLFNYLIFAWGCPAIIVITGWILDKKFGLQNDTVDCTSVIVPNYGQLNCYISKRAQGPYLYFPMGVLLGFNLLFYTLTVFKMCQYQRTSQLMTRNKSNGHFQPIVVFARLFIVMGVSWVFEILSWAFSPRYKEKVPLHWIVFDIVTLVQAIAIFVIFVCRKEILWKLKEKYPPLNCILDPVAKLFSCVQPTPAATSTPGGARMSISRNVAVQIDLNDISKIPSHTQTSSQTKLT